MSLRARVYAVLVLVLILGPGIYLLNQKFSFFPWMAAASERGKAKSDSKEAGDKKGTSDASPVELTMAKQGAISAFISSTGNLRGLREVQVASQADGVVHKVLAEEGDLIKEGQVLCELDDAQLKIRLELARERLAQAKLQMEKARTRQEKAAVQILNARTELERYQKAYKEGLSSELDVAQRKYRLDELEHDERVSSQEIREFTHRVAELEAEIAQAELELSRTRIRAPFPGYITHRTVELGQRVRNLDPLFTVGSFSPLFVDVHLSELDAQEVHPGQPALVRLGADAAAELKGQVERLSPIVDQSTGTVKVTIVMKPVAANFRPGAFVRVDIRTDTKAGAILVPKRAIIEEDGQNYVFVANGTTAKRTKVDVGYSSEGVVEIRNGIRAGEQVVVAGHGALKEGSKIRSIQS